jgi:hypothetical protein
MWLLVMVGVGLMLLARRGQACVILLSVPAYYLIVHSVLHTEYRYILAIHYFLFVFAGAALYFTWVVLRSGAGRVFPRRNQDGAKAPTT